MKKLFYFAILLSMPINMLAQSGKVYDNLFLASKILKMDRKYAIYLPPDYDISNRSYPVLYLLHGSGDDQSGWVQFGEVKHLADQAIAEGKATSMIVVMPDANTGRRGYFNSFDGDFPYEDFFFQELIPFIEKTYRARTEKRYRAVAGLSMGGGGTIIYALHRPDMFAAACPLSAGGGLQDWESFKESFKKTNPDASSSSLENYFKRHNYIELVNSIPDNQKNAIRWYVDCGDDDSRSDLSANFHVALKRKGVPHEFRIRNGGHNWTYWRESLPEVLKFISQSFHQF